MDDLCRVRVHGLSAVRSWLRPDQVPVQAVAVSVFVVWPRSRPVRNSGESASAASSGPVCGHSQFASVSEIVANGASVACLFRDYFADTESFVGEGVGRALG